MQVEVQPQDWQNCIRYLRHTYGWPVCQYFTGQTEAPANENKGFQLTHGGCKRSELVHRKQSLMPGCPRLIISVKQREILLNVNTKKKS